MTAPRETALPKLSAPARRALDSAGYSNLEQLSQTTAAELAGLHGMGPRAIETIRAALAENALSFKD